MVMRAALVSRWKACFSSTWAGQSLSKYVLSRRADTDSAAAHVVPTEAFSSAFSLAFHSISYASVVTDCLTTSGPRSHKNDFRFRGGEKKSAAQKTAHELNSAMSHVLSKFWSIVSVLPPAQTPEYQIYTSENVLYTQTEQSLFWDFPHPCLQSYSLVSKTSNLHLTILFNQCWNPSI